MRYQELSLSRFLLIAVVVFGGMMASAHASTASEKVIHSFARSTEGINVSGALSADADGNMYGTSMAGGASPCSCGTVYKLSPPTEARAQWKETTLYSFQWSKTNTADGNAPIGRVIFDQNGNLYGATKWGGNGGRGVIFQLSPPVVQGAAWTETILYAFPRNQSRGLGVTDLVIGPDQNLYGLTVSGGTGEHCDGINPLGCGTAFVLEHPTGAGGPWVQHLLYDFGLFAGDSSSPQKFVFSPSGTLYGIASSGGLYDKGAFFKLARQHGKWSETILYNFTGGNDGWNPSTLTFDPSGNAFGTIAGGSGSCQCGAIFELVRPSIAGAAWAEVTVYSFTDGADSYEPLGPPVLDKSGNLYGVTPYGGDPTCDCGTIFQIAPPAIPGEEWTQTTLHTFLGHDVNGDGANPWGGLVFFKGKFYGVTNGGGRNGVGSIFSLVVLP